MRTATTLIALSVLATVATASLSSQFASLKSKLFKRSHKVYKQANEEWPELEWPGDNMSFGSLYTYNETTGEYLPFANTTVDTYVDITGNREKVITQTDIPNIGFAEIITYFDVVNHIAYQKIPKIEQCKTYQIPEDFNLTTILHEIEDQNAGVTTYEGIVSLPWVTNGMQYYKFHVQSKYVNETIYFCPCRKVKFI